MRACSKSNVASDAGAFIAGGVTIALGLFFWLPAGRRSVTLLPPVALEGKTWILHEAAAPQAKPPRQQEQPARREASMPRKPRKTKRKTTAPGRKQVAAPSAMPPSPAPAVRASVPSSQPTSAVAVAAVIPPGTLDPVQQYSAQDIIDSFESDPARYPLDKTIRVDGIALTLEGLQQREKFFVAKVAVANGTEADFFIKDFSVRSGTTVLGCRTLFRILVEPQRVREGYVVFEKPHAGVAVQIKLKEDGGKGRAVETAIPYRF